VGRVRHEFFVWFCELLGDLHFSGVQQGNWFLLACRAMRLPLQLPGKPLYMKTHLNAIQIVMLCPTVSCFWIPAKMGEPICVTVSERQNNPSRCGGPCSPLSGRGICTSFSDLGHTCLTWLLLCGDSMCMCTSRSTFLHILLAKMFCSSSLGGIVVHPRGLTAIVGINILAFLFGSFSLPCYVILSPCDQLNYSYCSGFNGISTYSLTA